MRVQRKFKFVLVGKICFGYKEVENQIAEYDEKCISYTNCSVERVVLKSSIFSFFILFPYTFILLLVAIRSMM